MKSTVFTDTPEKDALIEKDSAKKMKTFKTLKSSYSHLQICQILILHSKNQLHLCLRLKANAKCEVPQKIIKMMTIAPFVKSLIYAVMLIG